MLLPEIWIAVAERTGIDELRRTTRDEPDYDVLMRGRLALLDRHGLTLSDDRPTSSPGCAPLPGAVEFLDALRARTQVMLLSDTFAEFARPLMAQLGWPTIFCHDLRGRRRPHRRLPAAAAPTRSARPSRRSAASATGSSPAATRTTTCRCCCAADTGLLFRAPPNVRAEYPELPAYDDYDDLTAAIDAALGPIDGRHGLERVDARGAMLGAVADGRLIGRDADVRPARRRCSSPVRSSR